MGPHPAAGGAGGRQRTGPLAPGAAPRFAREQVAETDRAIPRVGRWRPVPGREMAPTPWAHPVTGGGAAQACM
eukprot:7422134-Lingulodinium_polyedra.AAC.1